MNEPPDTAALPDTPLRSPEVAEPTPANALGIDNQYAVLIYPFRHEVSGAERAERLNRLEASWLPWWSRFAPDAVKSAIDDTLFFLPYVRELLFPELAIYGPALESSVPMSISERLLGLTAGAMAVLPADALLRLSFNANRLRDLNHVALEQQRKDRDGRLIESFSFPFELCWVDATLFPQNVGFLSLKVRLEERCPRVAQLRDFLHVIRLVHPPRVDWVLPSWKVKTETHSTSFAGRDLVDYLLQGLAGSLEDIEPDLMEYLNQLAGKKPGHRYTESPHGQTYGQIFNIFAFGLLEQPAGPLPGAVQAAVEPEAGPGLFDSPANEALYELATCTNSANPDFVPARDYLAQLWSRSLFSHWDNWKALVLHDNAVFLAVRDSGFTRYALGQNVENDYLHLYLLTLYQKLRMSLMVGEQMMRDSQLHQNLKKARLLWNSFLAFQDHFWFREATRSRQGTDLYHHFQEALDVIALHQQLSAQVRELQDHYEGRNERRLARLINLITFIGMPTSFVLSLFSHVFVPPGLQTHHAIWLTIFVSAAFFALWRVWTYYVPE
jgi:hypothetical protein